MAVKTVTQKTDNALFSYTKKEKQKIFSFAISAITLTAAVYFRKELLEATRTAIANYKLDKGLSQLSDLPTVVALYWTKNKLMNRTR